MVFFLLILHSSTNGLEFSFALLAYTNIYFKLFTFKLCETSTKKTFHIFVFVCSHAAMATSAPHKLCDFLSLGFFFSFRNK